VESYYRRASRLAWRLRQEGRPLFWADRPPDGRFFRDGDALMLWEWRLEFPPAGRPVAVIDLETTGLYPGRDGVTEIAVVRLEGSEKRVFTSFVNPGRPIPPKVQRITGITDADVADAPPFEEVLLKAKPLLEDAVWVIQNASFDLGFLNPVLSRIGFKIDPKVLDTLRVAKRVLPGLRSYRLGHLAEVLAWPGEGFHRALADAEATLWVLHELYYLRANGRLISLEEL